MSAKQHNRGHSAKRRRPQAGRKRSGKSPTSGGPSRSSAKGRNRKRTRPQGPEGPSFWGRAQDLPPVETDVRITDEPAAVPRSLGPAPLPGHEGIAEHYFTAVYNRAVITAGALAAAGGLIDPGALHGAGEH